MRGKTVCSVVSLLFAARLVADGDVQKVAAQVPYNATEIKAPAGTGAGSNAQTTTKAVIVHLDNTGVNDWSFINPRHPALIPEGSGVQFVNDTSDRTFVVTIPVTLKAGDSTIKFAVLSRTPGTAENRLVLVTSALKLDAGPRVFYPSAVIPSLTGGNTAVLLDRIDSAIRVRELLTEMDPAAMPGPAVLDGYKNAVDAALKSGKYEDFKAAADLLTSPPFKPLADRIKALVARRDLLEKRIPSQAPAIPSAAPPASLNQTLAANHALIADYYKQKEAEPDPKKKEEISAKLERLTTETSALEASMRMGKVEAETASFSESTPPPDPVTAEKRYIDNELIRLGGDVPALIDALLTFQSTYLTGRDEAAAKAETLKAAAARVEALLAVRKKEIDDRITTLRDSEARDQRGIRNWMDFGRSNDVAKHELSINVRNQALAELAAQGKTDLEDTLGIRFGSVAVSQCDKTALTCTATITVPPQQAVAFPAVFITEATPATAVIKFKLRFFDEIDTPSNDTVYMARTEKPAPPPNSFTWNMVGSVGQKRDPDINASTLKFNPDDTPMEPADKTAPVCAQVLCTDGHKNHFNGSAQVQLKQSVADYFEGSGTVQFKTGDLGVNNGKDLTSDQTVSFTQYKFSVFANNGLSLDFGKFNFAKPTNGISINETGEGFRIVYSPAHVSGGYIVRRESEKFTASRSNRDKWAAIVQLNKLPLSTAFVFRSISATWVEGKDDQGPIKDVTGNITGIGPGYRYRSYGAELSYAVPVVHVNGNFGFYNNERNVDNDEQKCTSAGLLPCTGKGRAGMFTMTRSFGLDSNSKPARSLTLTSARGTGDRSDTDKIDEGYVGEGGGFAPDIIFLQTLVKPINTTTVKPSVNATYPLLRLGSGLANKDYFGLAYTENRFSPLNTLVHDVFGVKDISSYSTTVKYHNYRLRRDFAGERGAGHEFNIESLIEGPKGVKTTLGGAYYRPGAAVQAFVTKNLWSLYSNVSISFAP